MGLITGKIPTGRLHRKPIFVHVGVVKRSNFPVLVGVRNMSTTPTENAFKDAQKRLEMSRKLGF